MTDYTTYEISTAEGKPIELYDIAMGTTHWRLTSGQEDYTYLYHIYEALPCKRSEVEQTGEIPKDGLDLTTHRGHALGNICINSVPEEEITITIYRGHEGYFVTFWTGYLTGVKFDKEGVPTYHFEPLSSDLRDVGGRRRIQRQCDLPLYGYRCGVNREAFIVNGTIEGIDELQVTSSDFGDALAQNPAVYGDLTKLAGCTYSASSNPSNAEYAFDDISRSAYTAGTNVNVRIWCKWLSSQLIKKIRIRPSILIHAHGDHSHINSSDFCMKHFRVAGSNNGSSWTTIPVMEWIGNCHYCGDYGGSDTEVDEIADYTEWIGVILDNNTNYTYYGLYVYDTWGGDETLAINEIEMIEADNSMSNFSLGSGGIFIVDDIIRTIVKHEGDVITLSRRLPSSIIEGMSFAAYPGCDHSPQTCRDRFSNGFNFGGCEFLSVENPCLSNIFY